MNRVLLDSNVLISGVLSPGGTPAAILDAWEAGDFDVVVSPILLEELTAVLARAKVRRRISADQAAKFVTWIRRTVIIEPDPPAERGLTADPGDDFIVALARASGCDVIVSGDTHLTGLKNPRPPVLTPRALLDLLGS